MVVIRSQAFIFSKRGLSLISSALFRMIVLN